jgi:basic membrane protein A
VQRRELGRDRLDVVTHETTNGDDRVTLLVRLGRQVRRVVIAGVRRHVGDGDIRIGLVRGLQYNTAQGGFLGGYLAAGMTKTGKVATWGGLNIPPVTIYMDGFFEGVKYYNAQKSKNVQVLGWDEAKQKAGTFSGSFTDQTKGQSISQTLISQGADIIFPVAGGAGLGAGAAAKNSGGKVSVIWVDTDGCVSASQYCSVFLSSVTKNLTDSVTTYIKAAASGTFPTGSYVGTLQNNGTGLAPFHDFDSKVPADLKSELDQVKADIISGKIKLTSPSQPAA